MRAKRGGGEDGQIVLTALLGLLPLLVLVLSYINTTLIAQDRVRRQNAADSAALSAAALEARAMNVISASNVAMTYLLGEAMAEEAFLRSLREGIEIANIAIVALAGPCATPYGAAACAMMEAFKAERSYLQNLQTAARSTLPRLCSFPGSAAEYPNGGLLFQMMRSLEGISTAIAAAPTSAASIAAMDMARANGSRGGVFLPVEATLPVKKGEFRDLGDPTRYGSRTMKSGFSPAFQRGYKPIIGLPWEHGPLRSCANKFRILMIPAVLVGGPWVYDDALDDTYSDWIGAERAPRLPGRAIFSYEEGRQQAGGVGWTSYLQVDLVTVPLVDPQPPAVQTLITSRASFVGLESTGVPQNYRLAGVSTDVDQQRSSAARKVKANSWADPEDMDASGALTRLGPGLWQVGAAVTKAVSTAEGTRYVHSYRLIAFQMAYRGETDDPYSRVAEVDEEIPSSHLELLGRLPRPHLLDGLARNGDVGEFRAKTFGLAVVWGDLPDLLGTPAFLTDRPTQLAYAQAEVYNGTSWDLFTQDWRVRLVPASLLEESGEWQPGGLPQECPAFALGLFRMPEECAPWLNTH